MDSSRHYPNSIGSGHGFRALPRLVPHPRPLPSPGAHPAGDAGAGRRGLRASTLNAHSALNFPSPAQRAQHSIYTPSTRFSRRAQLFATLLGGGGGPTSAAGDGRALAPRPTGVTAARNRLTPCPEASDQRDNTETTGHERQGTRRRNYGEIVYFKGPGV